MKKIIFLFILFTCSINAQNLSYGVVLGANFYEAGNNNSSFFFTSNDNYLTSNLGAYAEYNFTKNIGIKTEVAFNNKNLLLKQRRIEGFVLNRDCKISFFEISPSFKYDFGQEYRKGIYMLLGPKFSFLTKATIEGVDAKETFNKTNVGVQLGFGYRLFKYVDIQMKLDGEITPFFEANNNDNDTSNFLGTYVSLNIDLERFINSK